MSIDFNTSREVTTFTDANLSLHKIGKMQGKNISVEGGILNTIINTIKNLWEMVFHSHNNDQSGRIQNLDTALTGADVKVLTEARKQLAGSTIALSDLKPLSKILGQGPDARGPIPADDTKTTTVLNKTPTENLSNTRYKTIASQLVKRTAQATQASSKQQKKELLDSNHMYLLRAFTQRPMPVFTEALQAVIKETYSLLAEEGLDSAHEDILLSSLMQLVLSEPRLENSKDFQIFEYLPLSSIEKLTDEKLYESFLLLLTPEKKAYLKKALEYRLTTEDADVTRANRILGKIELKFFK